MSVTITQKRYDVRINQRIVRPVVTQQKISVVTIAKQGPPGPPGANTLVVSEIPSGSINGSNATFTTAFAFVPESVQVRVNGLGQRKPQDFNTSGTLTIIFTDSPQVGDGLQVDYQRA